MIEAHPLQFPVGYKRTPNNKKVHAQFKTNFASARDACIKELKMLGAKEIIISTNIPLKKDGMPYAVPFGSLNVHEDTGIAVYFIFNNEQKVICCDAYLTFDDNMQAIHKSVAALRGLDRWGCSEIINQTFTGFKAIPEKVETKAWYEILQVPKDADEYSIKAAYKRLAMLHHPDKGGNPDEFSRIAIAYKNGLSQKCA